MESVNSHPKMKSRVPPPVVELLATFLDEAQAVLKRWAWMVLTGVAGMVVLIRSAVDYRTYLEISVGPAARERANDAGWVQDALLWSNARRDFWLDILAEATERSAINTICLMALVVSVAISVINILHSRKQSKSSTQ